MQPDKRVENSLILKQASCNLKTTAVYWTASLFFYHLEVKYFQFIILMIIVDFAMSGSHNSSLWLHKGREKINYLIPSEPSHG